MTALRHNALQGRWLRLWLTVSFAVMFTGPFLFHSRVALLNVVDVLFFLPSLTLIGKRRCSTPSFVPSSMDTKALWTSSGT